MDYKTYVNSVFNQLCQASPANCTKVENKDNKTIIDMGLEYPGGWTSVKLMLEALIGGRGIINVTRDLRGLHQYPAIETLYDDPVGAYEKAFDRNNSIYGIKDDSKFVFGISYDDNISENGNFICLGHNSLALAAFDTCFALADSIKLLLENDIKKDDILWAWSFSPLADLCNDKDAFKTNLNKARQRRVVSIWLREKDEKLMEIVSEYKPGTLRLHNMVSARTIMVEGPAIRINC